MVCLNEASDHLAHAELAEKLEASIETARRKGSQVLYMCGCALIRVSGCALIRASGCTLIGVYGCALIGTVSFYSFKFMGNFLINPFFPTSVSG